VSLEAWRAWGPSFGKLRFIRGVGVLYLLVRLLSGAARLAYDSSMGKLAIVKPPCASVVRI
jgi:hypothetical protein